MSAAEIFILVLMGIIALQIYLMHRIIGASLDTMRSCSETTDKAANLAMRVLDDLVDVRAESSAPSPAERGTP